MTLLANELEAILSAQAIFPDKLRLLHQHVTEGLHCIILNYTLPYKARKSTEDGTN